MSFIEKVEQLSKAAEEGVMFEEVDHPAWDLLPTDSAEDQMEYKKAIKTIFARAVEDSPQKDRIVSFYADYALNSLLFCGSVRRIEQYSSYDVEDDFESWPHFIRSVSERYGEDGHWSKEDWRKVVYHFLREETLFPAQFRALEAEVGLTREMKKIGDSFLFIVLEQYREDNLLTFDSLMRIKDEIEEKQADIFAKKRKFENLLCDQEAFMQSVMA